MGYLGAERWEEPLKRLFDEIDDFLEDNYGARYKLHPARPARGETSSKSHDGLFNIGANFSLGVGSKYGDGYVLDARISTLEDVDPELKKEIEDIVCEQLREKLPRYFPGRELYVDRDGSIIKIHGDLSLGDI